MSPLPSPFSPSSLALAVLLSLSPAFADPEKPASDSAVLPMITLHAGGPEIDARADLLGHNLSPIDWQGHGKKFPPILWSVELNAPNPAWETLTHAYPLRHMRFNVGNVYPWKKGIGPLAERKVIKVPGWEPPYRTEAGLDEFLRWLESLPENPGATLIVSPFLPVQDAADLVAYCNATTGAMAEWRAKNGHPEPYNVKTWELGNETDWVNRQDLDVTRAETDSEKAGKLPVSEYVTLCQERVAAMRAVDPTITIYAHAATAPFAITNPTWRAWHREVLRKMGGDIDGISLHPYYDGYTVPVIMESIDALAKDIHELQPPGKNLGIWLSEHSKWIDYEKLENRPQSWGLAGAISTADFLLQCMGRPDVKLASYWYYVGNGPWRVLNADWENGAEPKFGTGVHAMFQLMNAAYRPRFETLKVEGAEAVPPPANYSYTVSAGRFSDPATGRKSWVLVNRSPEQAFSVQLAGVATGKPLRQLVVTGDSLQATNVPATPDAVQLKSTTLQPVVTADGKTTVTLPARSVTAWIEE